MNDILADLNRVTAEYAQAGRVADTLLMSETTRQKIKEYLLATAIKKAEVSTANDPADMLYGMTIKVRTFVPEDFVLFVLGDEIVKIVRLTEAHV